MYNLATPDKAMLARMMAMRKKDYFTDLISWNR